MRPHIILLIASIFGALAVAIGAFGAHALKNTLEQNERLGTFETASRYHFYHAIALLVLGVISMNSYSKYVSWSSWSFIFGILFFSGSLYMLSVTNYKLMGAIAPLGGLLLILGWLLLFWHLLQTHLN